MRFLTHTAASLRLIVQTRRTTSLEFVSMPRATLHALFALVLIVGLAAEARASLIVSTPAGIKPGGSFIVTFVDTTIGHATDGLIADYNSAIATAAANIVYPGGSIGSWQILGATATADPAATAFSSSLPVYDDVGHLLGTSGSEWLAAGSVPEYNQTGTASNGRPTWTGLLANGNAATGDTLGSTNVIMGQTDPPPPGELSLGGLNTYGPQAATGFGDYYGFAVFTAAPAPEPGTLTLALMGIVVAGGARFARRRRGSDLPAESGRADS
jgi:PEP-CTERM motif